MGSAPGRGSSSRIALSRWLSAIAIVGGLAGAVDARRPGDAGARLPLDIVTRRDAERVGAIGTGCTWRGGPRLEQRMSIADDRGAIRRDGRLIALKPTTDAKPLFFTYDRWAAGAMYIAIRDTGKVVRRGPESSETIAWLDLAEEGRTRTWRGLLSCGS